MCHWKFEWRIETDNANQNGSKKVNFPWREKLQEELMKELKTHKHTEQTPMSHFKIVDLKAFEIIFNFIEKLFTEKIIKV